MPELGEDIGIAICIGHLGIGIDDETAELAEGFGDERLSAADAADDADDGFACVHGSYSII